MATNVPLEKTTIPFHQHLCIICQKSEKLPTNSPDNGRGEIIEAANIRRDVVHQRLLLIEADFCYHVSNDCYKRYTLKKTLDHIKDNQTESNNPADDGNGPEEPEEPPKKRQGKLKSTSAICYIIVASIHVTSPWNEVHHQKS